MDITVNPPGECLQNLITLNGITLLDLWMDVSHSLTVPLYFGSSSRTHMYTTTPPPATIIMAPFGAVLWKMTGGFLSRALESC